MKKNYLIVLLGLMMGPLAGWGQYVANDYQSNTGAGLLWTNAANWRMYNGAGWNAYGADGTPSAARTVYIQGAMSTNGSQKRAF